MLKSLRELPEEMKEALRDALKFEGLIGFVDFYRYEGDTLMGKGYLVFDSMDRVRDNEELYKVFVKGTCYMLDHDGIDDWSFGGLSGGSTWKPFDIYEDTDYPEYTMRRVSLEELINEVS